MDCTYLALPVPSWHLEAFYNGLSSIYSLALTAQKAETKLSLLDDAYEPILHLIAAHLVFFL